MLVWCQAEGAYVHPDDWTDGWTVEDERLLMEARAEADYRAMEDYWETDAYLMSTDFLGRLLEQVHPHGKPHRIPCRPGVGRNTILTSARAAQDSA